MPDTRGFDSRFARFTGFIILFCHIPHFILLYSDAPTATFTLRFNGDRKQAVGVGTVLALFLSVFGIVLDIVASFSCYNSAFRPSGIILCVIASFSNVSYRFE